MSNNNRLLHSHVACLFFVLIFFPLSKLYGATLDFSDLPDCAGDICLGNAAGYDNSGFLFERFLDIDGSEVGFAHYSSSNSAYDGGGLLASTNSYFRISRIDGGAFDIQSLVLRGGIDISLAEEIQFSFLAEYTDGSSIGSPFSKNTANNSYQETVEAGWLNLISLTLSDDNAYAGANAVSFEIDSFQATAAVPLPGGLILFVSSLFGLKLRQRGFTRAQARQRGSS